MRYCVTTFLMTIVQPDLKIFKNENKNMDTSLLPVDQIFLVTEWLLSRFDGVFCAVFK